MRNLFFAATLVICSLGSAFAQNLQPHYDFRRGADKSSAPSGVFTTTVEMFKPDKYGSTFFFVDMNYGENGIKGVSLAYWEIARSLKFWDAPFAAHVEYNGGLGIGKPSFGFQIKDAWLFGVDYIWNNESFTKGFTLQAMYKYIQGFGKPSFQLTGVWYMHLFNSKVTFSGFADFWKETSKYKRQFIFLSEPQLWYNVTKKFSVGTELECSVNMYTKGFAVYPTAAVKYNF